MTRFQRVELVVPLAFLLLFLGSIIYVSFYGNGGALKRLVTYAGLFSAVLALKDFAGFIVERYKKEEEGEEAARRWETVSVTLTCVAFIAPLALFPAVSDKLSEWFSKDSDKYTLFTLGAVVITYFFHVLGNSLDETEQAVSKASKDNKPEAEKAVDKDTGA